MKILTVLLLCRSFGNLTKFVTEFIFVGYTIKSRIGKQTVAFPAVTWFTIC